MKILLAEDDTNIAMIAKLTLEHVGEHTVTLASNGAEALELALHHEYDVILLDEMMPHKNGLLVCTEYRSQAKHPAPVIFLSAKNQKEDLEEFHKIGNGYISKPFDPTELCKRIDEILSLNKSA